MSPTPWKPVLDTLRDLVHRRRLESELDEELLDHVERDVAHRIARGVTPDEARRQALAELGGVERVKDEVREARHIDRFDALAADIRHAVRRVRHAPFYSALVILTIGAGVGAGTAVFSAVDGVLLKPLPFHDPDGVVTLWQTKRATGVTRDDVAPGNFLDWQARARHVVTLAAASPSGANLRREATTEVVEAWRLSEGMLELLGARAMRGRTFRPDDFLPNAGRVVLVSHDFWQGRLGGDPAVVGSTLALDESLVTVIGVMPPSFAVPERVPLWMPWIPDAQEREDRFGTYARVFGRLQPGVTLANAQGELATIGERLAAEYPRANAGVGVAVIPLVDVMVGGQRPLLWTLLAAAGLLVLVTLANVSALHLTRLSRQRREAAMRAALGASRLRLARPLVVEAAILALGGGALGLAIGAAGVRLLHAVGPVDLPRLDEIALDLRAALAACTLALTAAVTLAVLSVARLRGSGASAGLLATRTTTGGRTAMRARRAAVAAQLALSLVLLVGTALLVASFKRVLSADRGYRTDHVLAFTTWVRDEYPEATARLAFVREVIDRLGALPGVRIAAMGSALPLAESITGESADVLLEGATPAEGEEPQARATIVTDGYFAALGMRLERGRLLREQDDERAERVVVVNESFARQFFPGVDPIGRMVRVGFMRGPTARLIVGVVGDTRHARLDAAAEPAVFIPWRQQSSLSSLTFVARTDVEPGTLAETVRRTMFAIDPRVGVARLTTLEALADGKLRERRFLMLLLAAFAAMAVALAAIGVFGVMSQAVADRQREIGVRMALGAAPWRIVQQFLGEAARLTMAGVAMGMLAALVATRSLTRFLYETTQLDPAAIAGAIGVVAALATVAALLPTWRAARTNPARTLGSDG